MNELESVAMRVLLFLCAAAAVPSIALAQAPPAPAAVPAGAAAVGSFVGRPIYSEPGAGLQLPPGCSIEPTWRGRLSNTDIEAWIVSCQGETRGWVVRRSIIEVLPGNQARLRFVVTDERRWPGETAGDSVSVQCVGRAAGDVGGYVVVGAKWRPAGAELRLTGATEVLRVDPTAQRFAPATLGQVDCTRHPEREAMMRRLQQR